jgi:hypothetical protein
MSPTTTEILQSMSVMTAATRQQCEPSWTLGRTSMPLTTIPEGGLYIMPLNMADEATVRALVGLGADVEAADTDGWQALHHAAENGHESTVRALVELGADVNAAGNTTGERCILPLGMATRQRSEHSSNLAPMSTSPTPTAIGRYTLPLIMVTRQRCERSWQ